MRRETKADLIVLALLAATYAYFPDPAIGVNGAAHFAQTYMVVHHHTLAIDPFVDERYTCDWSRHDGHYYPGKAPGLSLLMVPLLMGAVSVELLLGLDAAAMPVTNAFITNLVGNTLLAAFAGFVLLRTLRSLGIGHGVAIASVVGVTVGSAYFPYATALHYSHTPSAALCVLAAAAAFAAARGANVRWAALAGFLAGLATLTEYACALVVPILAVYLAARARPRGRVLLAYALGGLPVALVFFAYHWACFGGPLVLAYHDLNPIFPDAGSARLTQLPQPRVLLELTFLPYRGAFFFSPVLLLAFLGLGGARRAQVLPEALVGGVFALALLLATATFNDWVGGFTTGPRYFVAGTPLLAVLVAFGMTRTRAWSLAPLVLSVLGYLAVTYVRYDMTDQDHAPLSTAWADFLAGSYARPNLGHRIGLPGLASLLPLALVVAGGAWAVARLLAYEKPLGEAPVEAA